MSHDLPWVWSWTWGDPKSHNHSQISWWSYKVSWVVLLDLLGELVTWVVLLDLLGEDLLGGPESMGRHRLGGPPLETYRAVLPLPHAVVPEQKKCPSGIIRGSSPQ